MGSPHDSYINDNLASWNSVAPMHAQGSGAAFYRIEQFLEGECTLGPWEPEELGPVAGKTLLHLQCHIGTDTLSWARHGAHVTGLDFSPAAIDEARRFADLLGIDDARFVVSTVMDGVKSLDGQQFDLLYTGRGALCWLPVLDQWASVCAQLVRPGGTLYLEETHPTANLMDLVETSAGKTLQPRYDPFVSQPVTITDEGSYADRKAKTGLHTNHCWEHGFADLFRALINNGFRIDLLNERQESFFIPWEEVFEPWIAHYWKFKDGFTPFPMSFTLKATRDKTS